MTLQSISIWRALVNGIRGALELHRAWRDDTAAMKRKEAESLEKMLEVNRRLSDAVCGELWEDGGDDEV